MRRIGLIAFAAALFCGCLFSPVVEAQDPVVVVKVSVPPTLLSPDALSEIESACRLIASGESPRAAAALQKAVTGTRSTALAADLSVAAARLLSTQNPPPPPSLTGDHDVDAYFFLVTTKADAAPKAFFCLPLNQADVWLTPYLKEPLRLRPDLPENLSGITADISALPAVIPVDLVAASAPGALSAWIPDHGGSGKVVVFRNLIAAYARDHLQKAAVKVLPAAWSRCVDGKALEWLVAMRRLAHGLGPVAVQKGAGAGIISVTESLKDTARALEIIKADGLALLSGVRLAREQDEFGVSAEKIIATFVIYLLDRALHGSGDPARAFGIILTQLVTDGGIRMDLKSGRLIPDSRLITESMRKLVQRVVRIQGSGTEAEARELLEGKLNRATAQDHFVALFPLGLKAFNLQAEVKAAEKKP